MLEQIQIRNLGLIRQADVQFTAGLVVVTGETGAGKTLLLEAINALAGKKPGLAGVQSDTTIDGWLNVESQTALIEIGAELEDSSVLINRTFPEQAKARTFVGGRPVAASWLAEFSDQWLSIHGQHDTLKLLKPNSHRELLDKYAGAKHLATVAEMREQVLAARRLQTDLETARAEQSKLQALAAEWKADLAVCETLDLHPGEDLELAAKIDRIARAEQVRAMVSEVLRLLDADEVGATSQLFSAARTLEQVLRNDTDAIAIVERLRGASAAAAEAAHEVASLLDDLEVDPAALDALMLRQRQIKSLLTRHGPLLSDLLNWQEQAARSLALADPDGKALQELATAVASAWNRAQVLAAEVSRGRVQAAQEMSSKVMAELQDLAMPHAVFAVQLSEIALNEFGVDKVEFQFTANPGLPLTNIAMAASGGELSRLMLALEVTQNSSDVKNSPSVLVFDEIDAGVAGAAAISVAERLLKLAKRHQVLVVTHLAQIAAFADQQIKVSKNSDGVVTSTDISSVAPADRPLEIARMLAGLEDSQAAQQHAQELLQLAARTRTG